MSEMFSFPESTYRLQFHKGFTFRDATRIVPYLAKLGVTHLYASPYLKARPGSTHGYDVIDHCTLNPEVGTTADFEAWIAAMREHGLSHILDIVPNHVGVATNENVWWNDVLENGPSSRFANYFDIAWRSSPRPELYDKVLLPVLGRPYGTAMEAAELRVSFEAETGVFVLNYFDRRIPISPQTYARVLEFELAELITRIGATNPEVMELLSIIDSAKHLPDGSETQTAQIAQRHRETQGVKSRLAKLTHDSEAVRNFIEDNVAKLNGRVGDSRSFDRLDELLSHQCYRLSYWLVASDEINYRRFFDVNELAALRMEREEVFEQTHVFILSLVADGKVSGLRADHPDGLYDPEKYFEMLQRASVRELAKRQKEMLPENFASLRPLYVVAEKILAVDEPLPDGWAVHGTSGYDFLNMVNGLFIDPAAEQPFNELYRELTGEVAAVDDLIYEKKRLILQISMAGELQVLARQLDRIAQLDRQSRDFTLRGLCAALREIIACFPVYRSYITSRGVHPSDVANIELAVKRATARNPKIDTRVFDFVRDTLLQKNVDGHDQSRRDAGLHFAGKFQQLTSPVTAKGVEDTAFYINNRFISLNEVGGDLAQFGVSSDKLHEFFKTRQRDWPYSMSALSTHDTKRSEDVRARLNVLSEIPNEWREHVERWREINAGSSSGPTANDAYLLYQTLLGAWPLEDGDDAVTQFVDRVQAYMIKAVREAKINSSWSAPNEKYESMLSDFISRITNDGRFLEDFLPFKNRVARCGLINSLAQTLLRITAPGVPDTYQGCDLWDFSLVDPDNRRPVDFQIRSRLLDELDRTSDRQKRIRESVREPLDGSVKLSVTNEALKLRRDHPGLFTRGEYLPLTFSGSRADQLFGFVRRHGDTQVLIVVPRRTANLLDDSPGLAFKADAWNETQASMPSGCATRWRNVFTDSAVSAVDNQMSVSAVLGFPVAMLVSER